MGKWTRFRTKIFRLYLRTRYKAISRTCSEYSNNLNTLIISNNLNKTTFSHKYSQLHHRFSGTYINHNHKISLPTRIACTSIWVLLPPAIFVMSTPLSANIVWTRVWTLMTVIGMEVRSFKLHPSILNKVYLVQVSSNLVTDKMLIFLSRLNNNIKVQHCD